MQTSCLGRGGAGAGIHPMASGHLLEFGSLRTGNWLCPLRGFSQSGFRFRRNQDCCVSLAVKEKEARGTSMTS